jgi:hypothetical protein
VNLAILLLGYLIVAGGLWLGGRALKRRNAVFRRALPVVAGLWPMVLTALVAGVVIAAIVAVLLLAMGAREAIDGTFEAAIDRVFGRGIGPGGAA